MWQSHKAIFLSALAAAVALVLLLRFATLNPLAHRGGELLGGPLDAPGGESVGPDSGDLPLFPLEPDPVPAMPSEPCVQVQLSEEARWFYPMLRPCAYTPDLAKIDPVGPGLRPTLPKGAADFELKEYEGELLLLDDVRLVPSVNWRCQWRRPFRPVKRPPHWRPKRKTYSPTEGPGAPWDGERCEDISQTDDSRLLYVPFWPFMGTPLRRPDGTALLCHDLKTCKRWTSVPRRLVLWSTQKQLIVVSETPWADDTGE